MAVPFDVEQEGAAVGVAAAAGVPVAVGDGAEARVLGGQAVQRGVDGLLLRADEPDLHFAVGEREDLRPQHRRVGDAEELVAPFVRQAAGDDEEPGAVRRAVDVRRLNRR